MRITQDRLNKLIDDHDRLSDGTPYIEASSFGLKVGTWPDYIEVTEGGYVVEQYNKSTENRTGGIPAFSELVDVTYLSKSGKELCLIND